MFMHRGGSGGAQGASEPPLKKNYAERSRYSNRAVTLIKQSHDNEAVHNRLTMKLKINLQSINVTAICDLFSPFLIFNL